MNFPNLLTLLRIFLSCVLVTLVFWKKGQWVFLALAVFLLASLTDYWDGRLARKLKQESTFGELMDPIADKTLTLSAFGSFWALGLLPGLWVSVVAVRDVLVTTFRLFSSWQGTGQTVRSSGKRKTFFQMVYISCVLVYLALRRTDLWDPAWESAARAAVRGGMLVIVFLTLWSGLRVLFKSFSKSAS